MTTPSDIFRFLLHRIGVAGPARSRAFPGARAPKIRRHAAVILAVIAGTMAASVSTAAPALASSSAHSFSKTIGAGKGSAAGQLELASNSGMAVNAETHDVYVADTGNHRIDEFSDEGTFIMAFGKEVGPLGEGTCTTLSTCTAGKSGSQPGEFEAPTFIAIDGDPSSTSYGDVYVADTDTVLVQQFTAEGALVKSWGSEGQLGTSAIVVATGTADLEAGSTKITDPVATSGKFSAPQEVSGEGIPAGTSFNQLPEGLALTQPATITRAGVTLTAFRHFNSSGASFAGVAVDSSGDLWVSDTLGGQGLMYEFDQSGTFIDEWYTDGVQQAGLAIDGKNNLYLLNPTEDATDKFTSVGSEVETHFIGGGVTGLAVDQATDELYVDRGASIESFASSGSANGAFGSPQLSGGAGIAVDSSDITVYAANTSAGRIDVFTLALEANNAPANEITATTATLNGSVNPEGSEVSECYFEYGSSTEYEDKVACAQQPAAIGAGTGKVPVSADVANLLGGTTYHYRMVIVRGTTNLPTEDDAFTTLPVPVIARGEARELTASTAELTATVNPEGVQVLRCVFEYGTGTEYATVEKCDEPDSQIGKGTTPLPVSATISGLTPNTEYHWRLVVSNKNGSSLGSEGSEDHTFVYPTAGAALPDNRSYEMVTPPFKNGALFGAVYYGAAPSISEAGSRVIALTIQCFAPAESCTGARATSGEPFEFTRTDDAQSCEPAAPPCWETTVLAPPATEFHENNWFEFSATEGTALFTMPTGLAKEEEWYARFADGSFVPIGPPTPGATGLEGVNGSETVVLATPDLSHVVWQTQESESRASLYEYAGARNRVPLLVGVTGNQGSSELIATCELKQTTVGGKSTAGKWNALSADGRTVYLTVCGSELYARIDGETSEAHTVRISPGAGEFMGASEDGSKAFFVENQGLYESECFAACETLGEQRRSIDVSAPEVGGESPQVQGVEAISSDGSHVYFVAKGALTGQPNSAGQGARTGRDNLYVYQRDARYPKGHIAFIAALSSAEHEQWGGTYYANVTPEGRFLVFESHGDLTPDAHGDDVQIYRYDAETEQLVRISIGEDGFNDNGDADGEAAIVHAFQGDNLITPVRGDPTMSNDGSFVFFESPGALSPQALNNVVIGHKMLEASNGHPAEEVPLYAENVYEWHEGHVFLISDGHDTSAANVKPCQTGSAVCLLGTDASGHNVFFTTTDRLVPKDTDTQVDIYDARICEPEHGDPCIAEASPPLPPCDGETCHGIPAATPSLLAPGSATFNGEGNVTLVPPPPTPMVTKKTVKCKRGFVRNKKSKCVKARKQKSKQAKKSTRRAK